MKDHHSQYISVSVTQGVVYILFISQIFTVPGAVKEVNSYDCALDVIVTPLVFHGYYFFITVAPLGTGLGCVRGVSSSPGPIWGPILELRGASDSFAQLLGGRVIAGQKKSPFRNWLKKAANWRVKRRRSALRRHGTITGSARHAGLLVSRRRKHL